MLHEPREYLSTAYLVIRQGPQAGKRLEICKETTTIGRSRECDIFLEDLAVHRKQARIVLTDAGYVLQDDNGSGDSIVNGKPVQEQILNDGDQLTFGHTQLTFFSHDATRPFLQPSSRGRELLAGKIPDSNTGAIARLELATVRGMPRSFEVRPVMTIGRSRDCSIFLEDLAVSRLHATIRQVPDGGYELEDHDSATGTFVNGQRVRRCRLKPGDIIQLGTSKFTFRQ